MKFIVIVLFWNLIRDVRPWWTCPDVDCKVSEWTQWTPCSHSCGNSGKTTRTRKVTRKQECSGDECPHLSENNVCNRKCCPIDCTITWGKWGPCTGCGTNGTQKSVASVNKKAFCGGACIPAPRKRTCDTGKCCPVNCQIGQWGSWSSCNAQCEKQGTQTRTRSVTTQASCNGQRCPILNQPRACVGGCCPRDCVFSQWSSWTKCSAAAGVCSVNGGTQTRTRSTLKQATCNGKCDVTKQTQQCTVQSVQCQLSNWGSWSSCSPTNGKCGSGTRSRGRTVQVQPVCSAACGALKATSTCMHSCCPVNCVYNNWSSWSSCTNRCGQGMQTRTRTIKSQAQCNGAACQQKLLTETKSCTQYINVDCVLSTWSLWSVCDNGCGRGNQVSTRKVVTSNKCRGKKCDSLSRQQTCQSYRERTDCVVSQWSLFGPCSEKCAVGKQYRHRNITTRMVCGGKTCPTLTNSIACGNPNGGCAHACNNGICSCRPGYNKIGSTNCFPKDCKAPSINYCPPGEKARGACIYPTVNCASTLYPARCPLSCPIGYTLKGDTVAVCQTNGLWKQLQSYCKRDNEPPTDINLSGSLSVPENEKAGYVVGQLSTVDLNPDSFTYKLLSDGGCNCFSISANSLKTLKPFDFEATQNKFQVVIQTIDNGIPHLNFTKTFQISATDVNEKPKDVTISHRFIDENSDENTVVGTLQTVDDDIGQTFKYTIIDNAGGSNIFKINGNQLLTAKKNQNCMKNNQPDRCPINFEKTKSFSLMINAMDSGIPPLDTNKQIIINVRDKNDPPFNIQLSSSDVKENDPPNTFIGTVSATEEDVGQKLTYTLTDDDNGNFYIDSAAGKLYKKKPSDYESKLAHNVVVEVTDNGTPSIKIQRNFTINVIDINEPPAKVDFTPKQKLKIDNNTLMVPENTLQNTQLTDIVVNDKDSISNVTIQLDDTYSNTFSLTTQTPQCNANADKTSEIKSICTTTLTLSKNLNYELQQNYDLRVRVIDRGHSIVYHLKINVTDTNDPPTDVHINSKKSVDVIENQMGVRIGKLTTTDEDAKQLYTYQISSNDFSLFEIQGDYLSLKTYSQLNYEAKSKYSVNITSTDNGTPTKSVTRQIQINVIDANDPVTSVVLSNYTVAENTNPNILVAKITITDEDNQSPTPKSHPCYSHSGGYLDNQGHNVIVPVSKPKIDFESFQTFNYTITCIDKNVRSTWSFVFNVLDQNEAPTSISISNATIKENSTPPTVIGTLSTVDPDNSNMQHQTFKYTLMNNQGTFKIQGNKLVCIAPLDFESTNSLDAYIKVEDSATPPKTYSETITILVLDVNDKPVDIQLSGNIVDENSPQYTVIGNLSTVDSDIGQDYTYILTNDGNGRFEIDGNQLKVSQSNVDCLQKGGVFCTLNFEKSPLHQVTVVSTDNGTPPQSITKNFTINIRDINDSPRRISISNYTVHENKPAGTLIGKFTALDEDKGQILTFDLIGGDISHFQIDGLADLKLKTNFSDYETKNKYQLFVRVTDNGYNKLQHVEYLTIEVLDVNEAPIEITITDEGASQTFNTSSPHIAENTKNGIRVGTVYSYDEDVSASLTFALDDDSNGTFTFQNGSTSCTPSTQGKYKVTCKTPLLVSKSIDYEVQSSHEIIIRITDQGGLHKTQKFTITVIDVNDDPTDILLDGKHSVRVTEGLKTAQALGQFHTVDEDFGQTFDYQIMDKSMKNLFEIHNGVLYILDNVEFDYEGQNFYNLTVKSTDKSGVKTSKSVTKTFHIIIDDVNEAPAQIKLSLTSIPENSAKGTLVANITVEDPDNVVTQKQSHKCAITKSSSASFEISNAGNLVVKVNNIDYEQTQNISLSIKCSDNGSPSLSFTQDFVIYVEDVNEAPVDIRLSSNDIVENFIGMIGDLRTDDHDNFDGFLKQDFEYEIMNASVPFMIKDSTLYNTQAFDYEIQKSFTLTIKTTDNGTPRLSFSKQFTITVIDVNEPASAINLASKTVPENSGKGTVIGKISAVDEDRIANGNKQTHQFTLVENPQGLFRIDLMNQLEVAIDNTLCLQHGGKYCALNFEDNRYVTIKIRAKDNGSPPQSFESKFTIQLTDVNEQPKQLRLSNSYLPENASIGYIVGRFSFQDEDLGQSYNVTLTNDDKRRFSVDDKFNLIKIKPTNYEKDTKHVVTVLVTDNGQPPLSTSKSFDIFIQDVNESPTDLHITDKGARSSFIMDQPRIDENLRSDIVIGTIEAIDQDTVTDLVFSLLQDGNGMLKLDKSVSCQNITSQNGTHTSCQTKLLSNGVFNYEDENMYNIIIRVADHAGLSHLSAFNVSINDKNDRPTNVTVEGELTVFVRENSIDKAIGELETIDEDVNQRYKYELLDDAGGRFTITIGRLGGSWLSTTSKSINYEESSNYTVMIKTTDNGIPQMSFQHEIQIQIIDINETPSEITLSNYSVAENSPSNTIIGDVIVDDPDNTPSNSYPQTHSCILTDDAKNTFKLVNKQILVDDNKMLDYERNSILYIFVQCTDSGVPPLRLTKKIPIVVADVNEAPTRLSISKSTVAENIADGYVGSLRAHDPDLTNQKFKYELRNNTNVFHLNETKLYTKVKLDYETKDMYWIGTKVTDVGGLSIEQDFVIQVEDKNDAPYDLKCTGLSTPETSKSGSTLGHCSAFDQDVLQTHFFKITKIISLGYNKSTVAPYPNRLFMIETTTGRVEQIAQKLDHEDIHTYILTIQIADSGIPPLFFEKNVTLQVTNVNQPPTDILLDNKKVHENSQKGTVVGRVTVVDPDNKHKNVQGHTCIVESRDIDFTTSPLKITKNNELVVDDPTKLNYEFIPFHNIRINCTEDMTGGYKISRDFRIEILNVNEAPEKITLSPSEINEENQINDVVGTIQYFDPDNLNFEQDKITVTALSTGGAPFKLVPPYTVVATQELDYETISSYVIQVTVTDDGSPPLSSTKKLNITVNDVNDVPSGVKVSSTSIGEATQPGTTVATFTAIDHDKGQKHTFNLLDDAGVFKLSGNQLVLTKKLQYGVTKEVEILLEVTDNGTPSLSLQKSIKFTVTDSNDKPTDVLATTFSIPENTQTRYKIADLKVVDVDFGQTHTCQGIGADKDSIETQTEANGNITVYLLGNKRKLDYETTKEFSVKLQCVDNGVPQYSIDKEVKITVTDVNEAPYLIHIDNLQTIKVPENTQPDYVLGKLNCKDPDQNQFFTYSLQGNSTKYFKILPNSAMLITKNLSLNYEAPPGIDAIDVYIKVTDSGSPPLSYSGALKLKALDVNEPPQNITLIGDTKHVPENTTKGTHIAQLWADNPEGFKQELTFIIVPPSDVFEIVKTHAPASHSFISLKGELDYDAKKVYELNIMVEDNGSPALSSQNKVTLNIIRSDACILNTHNCPQNRSCSRVSKTKIFCTCNPGFEMVNGECVATNECKETCDNCEYLKKRDECKKGISPPCGPCVNDGKCTDIHMNFTCICATGFTGKNCYINIDDCVNSPCNNGSCIDGIASYKCDCYDGYEGTTCAKEINECKELNPCYEPNDQPCTDLINSYKCECKDSMSGTRCERRACGDNTCSKEDVCHSVDLKKAVEEAQAYRCIEKTKLAYLSFHTVFAPLSGDEMYSWKVKFEHFLKTEVKIPLSWIGSSKHTTEVLMTDTAIYDYMDNKARTQRQRRDSDTNRTTSLSFYGVVEDQVLTPRVLMYSINDTCDISYTECKEYNDQFKCTVCKHVKVAVNAMKRPIVLSSTGNKEDPLWMNVVPIVAIVLGAIMLLTLSVCIYRRRQSKHHQRLEDDDDNYNPKYGNSIEIMEQRSKTWNENDLNHYAGAINPIYGVDEEEVDNVINTSFKQLNPDGTVRQPRNKASRMFDNPLYGVSSEFLDQTGFETTNNTKPISDGDMFDGFTNPTFQDPSESEF